MFLRKNIFLLPPAQCTPKTVNIPQLFTNQCLRKSGTSLQIRMTVASAVALLSFTRTMFATLSSSLPPEGLVRQNATSLFAVPKQSMCMQSREGFYHVTGIIDERRCSNVMLLLSLCTKIFIPLSFQLSPRRPGVSRS